ncbi:MAG: YqaA family protein [Patescibacteria group bacterium]
MFNFFFGYLDRCRLRLIAEARGYYAKWYLAGVAFSESSFFIIPPDVILVAMIIAGANRWKFLALWTTLFSVIGGLAGYLIGWWLFDLIGRPIIDFYNLETELVVVGEMFNNNAFWAIFVSAFSPIPYKVFTIAAGFFSINIFSFLLASIVGRGLRFLIIAYLSKRFGRQAIDLVLKYFYWLSLGLGMIILLGLFYFYLF